MDANETETLKARHKREYDAAYETNADRWVPACGGTEVPFLLHGVRWLYVYNCATHKHGWLNMGQDIVYEQAPA